MHTAPDPAEIAHAAALLRAGQLVAFPTETVYGLGANALDAEAVARIYAVKRRPATSPLIVHIASIEMARKLVEVWPEIASRLAEKFWPGPLTMVLPAARAGRAPSSAPWSGAPGVVARPAIKIGTAPLFIPAIVTAGLPTVGLRMPAHPTALALIRAAGIPLAAPSANRFTELSPSTAEHVRESLGHEVDYILDGGPCRVGIESTVVSLSGPQPTLLRPGGISRLELEAVIGPLAEAPEVRGPHPAPGMHPRHYSPRTTLYLVENGNIPDEDRGHGLYLQHHRAPSHSGVVIHQMPLSASGYAAALYQVLHQADAGNYPWIAIDVPPRTPDWEAILDRLHRAATRAAIKNKPRQPPVTETQRKNR